MAATLSLLSLASLVWFPATVFIPPGRLLAFVWSVAVGLVLVFGKPRTGAAGGNGMKSIVFIHWLED